MTKEGVRVEIDYRTGIKEMWIYADNKDRLVNELVKLDYNLYKQKLPSRYYYMGYRVATDDNWNFEECSLMVKLRMNKIEIMADKLL